MIRNIYSTYFSSVIFRLRVIEANVQQLQPDLGGAMMGVPEGVHLDLGGILGGVGVEEEVHVAGQKEFVDMDGTCLVEA